MVLHVKTSYAQHPQNHTRDFDENLQKGLALYEEMHERIQLLSGNSSWK